MQSQMAIPPFTKAVKALMITIFGIWLVGQIILERFIGVPLSAWLALFPGKVLFDGMLWQTFSYIFLHSIEVSHILLNLLMLWFLGGQLENTWGSKYFIFYFLMSGVGAGLIYCIGVLGWYLFFGGTQGLAIPVVGSSGSVFGLMMAYGILFGDRTIHFMLLFPMKARVFVMILGAVEVLSLLTHGIAGGGVANLAHLGGLISGYLILVGTTWWKRRQRGSPHSKSRLKIVVDNEKDPHKKTRYWN